ncbi:MAG: class I adenylate-forming enzyme family protein [Rhizobiaceae bacterium]|nr:class I adenylate-forming enzyme family protein [Rhizobiaceae bacterium]
MNIFQTLNWHAGRRPEKPAVCDKDRCLNFQELVDMTQGIAARLDGDGIGFGERVVILSDNCIETIAFLHATALTGCIMVPANTRYAADELRFLLEDSASALVLFGTAHRDLLNAALVGLATKPRTAEIGDYCAMPTAASIAKWREHKGFEHADYGCIATDDVAMLIYTSGTTSRPKGAMLTHGNLLWNSINYIMESELHHTHSAIVATPLFHISGFGVLHGPLLHAGGTLFIIDRFSSEAVTGALKTFLPSHLFLVSAMWVKMTEDEGFLAQTYPETTFISTAAGPLSEARQTSIRDRFPNAEFGWGYGMTESCVTTIKSQRTAELEGHPGTLGYGWRHVQYRLVDEAGTVLEPIGNSGELQVRGPVVFKGYWNNEEATAEAIIDGGWLKSGDLFRFDEDGFAYFIGRSKDMVKTGGENVAAQEVEQAVIRCPGVLDAAAFGVPDDHLGEMLCVAIETVAEANLSETAVRDFCRTQLAGFKVPKRVHFVDALPRSSSDKPQKFKLTEMFK